MVRNLPVNAEDAGDTGSIPGSERSPGRGNDNQLHFSCLESPKDRGVWQVILHRVAKVRNNLATNQQKTKRFHYQQNYTQYFLTVKLYK